MNEVAASVIGEYLRNKAPDSLQDNTDRMCILLDGEYGNMMTGLLFAGLAGDIIAQDQVWAYVFNITASIPNWEESTGMDLYNITSWLQSNMGPETMGNWTALVEVPKTQCYSCSTTSTWEDISLWTTSVPVSFATTQVVIVAGAEFFLG